MADFFFLENNQVYSLRHIPQLSYVFSMCVSVYRGTVVQAFMSQCTLWLRVFLNANNDVLH